MILELEVRKIERPKLDKVYEKSMAELDLFFGMNWKDNRPNMFLVNDRKTIDLLQGRKTEDWYVGWSPGNNIYLLSDKTLEQESSHKYSDESYFARIKHELAHCFFNVVSGGAKKPTWLVEGVSIYLSGQNKSKPRPKELTDFVDFYEARGAAGVYRESGFAVEFLVEKHGKQKLLELMKRLKGANSKEEFADLFKSVYGFELSYENFRI